MATFIARRILFALVLLAAVSLFTYLLFALLPTDPAALTCGKNCKPELIEANRVRLGYDKPVHEQYFQFVKGIFAGRTYGTGDIAFTCPAPSLGYSFNQHECVSTLIGKTFARGLCLVDAVGCGNRNICCVASREMARPLDLCLYVDWCQFAYLLCGSTRVIFCGHLVAVASVSALRIANRKLR